MTERAYLAKVRYPSTLLRSVLAQPRPEADIVERQSRRAIRQESATNYPMALRCLERAPISIALT
jgi:hypothetical protein